MKKPPGARFVVAGQGPFPVDMLRYDSAFPDHETDAGKIERTFRNRGGAERIALRLVTDSPNAPTAERWRSFGWTVEAVEDR